MRITLVAYHPGALFLVLSKSTNSLFASCIYLQIFLFLFSSHILLCYLWHFPLSLTSFCQILRSKTFSEFPLPPVLLSINELDPSPTGFPEATRRFSEESATYAKTGGGARARGGSVTYGPECGCCCRGKSIRVAAVSSISPHRELLPSS